jgi:hypothetical protein
MAKSFLEGAAFMTAVDIRIKKGTKAALRKSAKLIQTEARRVLGTYDYDWPRLADSTIKQKKTGDSPGLETGAMRKSIRFSVDASGESATVGSNDPKLLWFELGTIHMPPRPVLMGASMRMEKQVHEICGKKLFAWAFESKATDYEDAWSYDGED